MEVTREEAPGALSGTQKSVRGKLGTFSSRYPVVLSTSWPAASRVSPQQAHAGGLPAAVVVAVAHDGLPAFPVLRRLPFQREAGGIARGPAAGLGPGGADEDEGGADGEEDEAGDHREASATSHAGRWVRFRSS
jgi:hypothetical protein